MPCNEDNNDILDMIEKKFKSEQNKVAELKDMVAMLLEDAKEMMKIMPNEGTAARINQAQKMLNK